jgi:hypothetical protein
VTEISGYDEFEFDLPEALLKRLIDALDDVVPTPLTAEALAHLPEVQGVYQLFLKRDDGGLDRVYIGKTDSEAGLKKRLLKHARKVRNRVGLAPEAVHFKALRVFVFTAIDLETQLIKHYGGVKAVEWNGSGFGANDPGRERDTTKYKAKHFDAQFPIDIDRDLDCEFPSEGSAADLLRALKRAVPYLIRFETISQHSRTAHADLEGTQVVLSPADLKSPATVISAVIRRLPAGWHATMLPSHVIIYKNDDRKFPSGRRLAPS